MYSHRFLYLAILVSILTAAVPVFASGFWTPPVYHPELNVEGYAAEGPCLSADGLTIYFGRYVPALGAKALFQAMRPDLDSAFGPQTMITELFHGVNVNAPWISADGLRLYYQETMQPDDKQYIRMAARSDVTQPWTVARTFAEIHTAGMTDCSPALSADELILAYQLETGIASDPRYICIAMRSSVDEPFGAPSRVIELGAGVSSGPFLSPDGLQLYCTRYPIPANSGDIMVATRASRTEPFSAPGAFAPFNKAGLSEQNAAFTGDMRQICYNGTYIVSPYTEGIYTSYWYEPKIGYELLDGDYSAEIVASYRRDSGTLGYPYGMEFGPDGSLYLVHLGLYDADLLDGTIYKVASDGTSSLFASGFLDPYDIVWGGGTSYGDFFYVTDRRSRPNGQIWKISPAGVKTRFATPATQPFALQIDRVGLYGGYLYATTSTQDHMYTITPGGVITKFSDFPYNDDPGWGVGGISFAPAGPYGGLMYALNLNPTPAGSQLLYTLGNTGIPSPMAADFSIGGQLHFDDTAQQYFGGGLFARAVLNGGSSPRSIFYVSPSGETSAFIRKAADIALCGFTFGPDGAMYVAEYNGEYDVTIISRILPAGPYFTALNNLGLASAAKKRAIADVDTAVASEKLALRALVELGRRPKTDIVSRRAILTAAQKVTVAKAQEEVALMLLRKSLPLVNEAWEILIEQVAPDAGSIAEPPKGPVSWPPVQDKPGK